MAPRNLLMNLYIVGTFICFAYLLWQECSITDNYFAAVMNLYQQPVPKFLIYNMIISAATLVYRAGVSLFFQQIKEIESTNMIEKLSFKILQFFYFIYISDMNFGIEAFCLCTFIFLNFLFHSLTMFRARYLINTHVMDQMNLNYRLFVHFLILIFFDFQIITHTMHWFFRSDAGEEIYIIAAYYAITIGMTIIEPAICFFMHFYEIYTESVINDVDYLNAMLNFYINMTRLIIQIILSLYISLKFTFNLLFLMTIIESVYELSKTYRNYQDINRWKEKIKSLETLNAEQIKQIDDKTCSICYHDFVAEATVLKGCKHIFHAECLRQWIIKNSNKICPTCKTPLDQKNDLSIKTAEKLREQIAAELEKKQKEDPLGFEHQRRLNNYRQENKTVNTSEPTENTNKKLGVNRFEQENQDEKMQMSESINRNNAQRTTNYTLRRIDQVRKQREAQIGSVPFGLPTEAVYSRKLKDVIERNKLIQINDNMIKLLKLQPTKQLLIIPEL